MTLLDNLPHTCRHERLKYTQGDMLDPLEDTHTVATGVSCWVQNASRNEIEEFDKRGVMVTHKVFFTSDPGLRAGDQLVITAGPSHVGETLKYQASSDRSAGLGVLFGGMFEKEPNPIHSGYTS